MTKNNLKQRPIVPAEYGGKWIAWDQEKTRFIASGRNFEEVCQAAEAIGEIDPVFERIPRSDCSHI